MIDRPTLSDDPLVLATANQRRASAPESSVWVAASAGTGKTKVLTDRVVRLLLAGTPPQRLLCLTYTKAATAEMATRIAARLSAWATEPEDRLLAQQIFALTGTAPDQRQLDDARRLFARVLEVPGGLRIQTLHAFCQGLLQRFPLEAGILPHFTVLDEQSAAILLAEAQDAVLTTAQLGIDLELTRALDLVAANATDTSFDKILNKILGMRGRVQRMLEHHGNAANVHFALAKRFNIDPDLTPEALIESACADSILDRVKILQLAEALRHGGATDQRCATVIHKFIETPASERVAHYRDYHEVFITKKEGTPRKNFPSKDANKFDPDCQDIAARETERLLDIADKEGSAEILHRSSALIRLSAAILEAYAERKNRGAWLDYQDLIFKARDLVAGNGKNAYCLGHV
ncbi:MAG: UvrD-helicase domain-containing protein [Alphaproteobacteria bacterium]